MSDSLDYWPFDYTSYVEEILPALQQAIDGQPARLLRLVEMGKQQGLSLTTPTKDSIPTDVLLDPGFASALGFPSTDEFLLEFNSDRIDFTWGLLAHMAPLLAGHPFGEYFSFGAKIHLQLVEAFCCPSLPGSSWLYSTGGDENIWLWREYFEGDKAWDALWKQFYQPSPTAIINCIPSIYDEAYPRGLNPFGEADRVTLKGFLTPEETRRLSRALPLHRKPFLSQICEDAARDYAMREWERQISLTIEDYQERKRQFYWERQEMLQRDSERRKDPDESVTKYPVLLNPLLPAHIRRDLLSYYHQLEVERPIKERLFGPELGSRLEYFEPFIPPKNAPGHEEERFFLVPKEIHDKHDLQAWREACPEEVEKIHQLYWPGLWRGEDEFMRRLNFAISHNLGMLMYYTSGK